MFKVDPRKSIFYYIDEAIKEYRKYAQKKISVIDPNITLDQLLTLNLIKEDPDSSQKELAQILFKDYASLTRIIELLVKKSYLSRSINQSDRRKFVLKLTAKGHTIVDKLTPVIIENRKIALKNISDTDLKSLKATLKTITDNCKSDL
ncbi:MarR family winged helix-turn-helix transcriptional regulator [Hanstruepera ponticola]|uniref:MarR family winged helix-turn-helix transcriptional regulator n=1 Tax=Hanstruepera ponticola TaxID=2042995 RepID=UPI000CF0C4AE|nr:MarR family transcriptional regulator [Hanstruepera ponticola]